MPSDHQETSSAPSHFKDDFLRHVKILERTQWMPPRELARYQGQLLERLVRHAYENLPFYRGRLACLVRSDGTIDLSNWNNVPLLTREDAITHGHELRTPNLDASYGPLAELQTSGSTGVPLQLTANALVMLSSNALFTRLANWFGADTKRPLASIRRFPTDPVPVYPEGSSTTGWSYAEPDAPLYALEVTTPIELQLEWIRRRRPAYLLTPPSGALALAHAVTPAEGRALGIELIFAVSEMIPDGARELVAERLGARIAGIYSCQEIGTIASECPLLPRYHAAEENARVEILDDDGRPVEKGERGRVVVTGLYNYAMPFIRYVLGDFATAGTGSCPCGRTLPVIQSIEGRVRNAFVFRDGTRVWPRGWMIRQMRPFVPYKRYQLAQLDYERIEFRYVNDGSGRKANLAGLNHCARRLIHWSVEMNIVEMNELLPGPSGKFEEFVSLVAVPGRA